MKDKILITGAGGYIGSVAAQLFLQKGYRVVALDNFSTGFLKPLKMLREKFGKHRIVIYKKDIRENLRPIFQREKNISSVIHYAGLLSVDESMRYPERYFENNVCGSQNLLSCMAEFQVKRIIFSSTCAVYGEARYMPVDENHPTIPSNPYGASKLMIEDMIRWHGKIHGLHYVILRYFNVCGASDDRTLGYSLNPSIHLVQSAIRGALGLQKFSLTCAKVKTPDHTPVRDYVNVVDLDRAHIQALEYLKSGGKSEVINIGTGRGSSVLEIIEAVKAITGKKFFVQRARARQGEYACMKASIAKAARILHFKPEHTLRESIQTLVLWYKYHPHGWNQ